MLPVTASGVPLSLYTNGETASCSIVVVSAESGAAIEGAWNAESVPFGIDLVFKGDASFGAFSMLLGSPLSISGDVPTRVLKGQFALSYPYDDFSALERPILNLASLSILDSAFNLSAASSPLKKEILSSNDASSKRWLHSFEVEISDCAIRTSSSLSAPFLNFDVGTTDLENTHVSIYSSKVDIPIPTERRETKETLPSFITSNTKSLDLIVEEMNGYIRSGSLTSMSTSETSNTRASISISNSSFILSVDSLVAASISPFECVVELHHASKIHMQNEATPLLAAAAEGENPSFVSLTVASNSTAIGFGTSKSFISLNQGNLINCAHEAVDFVGEIVVQGSSSITLTDSESPVPTSATVFSFTDSQLSFSHGSSLHFVDTAEATSFSLNSNVTFSASGQDGSSCLVTANTLSFQSASNLATDCSLVLSGTTSSTNSVSNVFVAPGAPSTPSIVLFANGTYASTSFNLVGFGQLTAIPDTNAVHTNLEAIFSGRPAAVRILWDASTVGSMQPSTDSYPLLTTIGLTTSVTEASIQDYAGAPNFEVAYNADSGKVTFKLASAPNGSPDAPAPKSTPSASPTKGSSSASQMFAAPSLIVASLAVLAFFM